MCGICGIIDFSGKEVQQGEILPMMQAMKHRGPDDEGTFLHQNLGLGFVRLSILDLSTAGRQPMQCKDGRYRLVYNGEIYNYLELRDELRTKGHRFKTGTDTEVLLAAWMEWGKECLHRFNGMWAFAIYDRKTDTLFAARDRFGIKPFYYTLSCNRFVFASEIPPLKKVVEEPLQENQSAIYNYLVYNRTDYAAETFFKNVHKLHHGCMLEIQLSAPDTLTISKWYDLKSRVDNAKPLESAEEFYDLFRSAVLLRLRSDVPVGVCLSGGLDSSAIVSVITKEADQNGLQTFSAIYGEGKRGDESEYIREFGDRVANMHYTKPTGAEFFEDMAGMVKAQAEPFPTSSIYAQYRVMKLAAGNAVVTLDGQGADEYLAGYHYFFGFLFKDLVKSLSLIRFFQESKAYVQEHRSMFGLKTFAYLMLPEALRTKISLNRKKYIMEDYFHDQYINRSISDTLYGSGTLREAMISHFEVKLEHLLKYQDRNSMFHSLEGRVPFLDYRLVERTLALSPEQIIGKGSTKRILRESMDQKMPEKIRLRKDKIGFNTPEDEWFRQEPLRTYIMDLLHSDSFRNRKIIDPEVALRLYQKHVNQEINISRDIWKWINLEMFLSELK